MTMPASSHLHSDYSHDGDVNLGNSRVGAGNGIDFVMLTTHDWLQAKHDGYERSYDGVHLFIGIEVTPRYTSLPRLRDRRTLITCDLSWIFPYEDEQDISPQFYIGLGPEQGRPGLYCPPRPRRAPRFHVKQIFLNDWTSRATRDRDLDFMTDCQSRLKDTRAPC